MEQPDSEQQLQTRRDVLQQAQRRKGNLTGARRKQEQWNRRNRTGCDQPEPDIQGGVQEVAASFLDAPHKKRRGQGKQQQGFQRQTLEWPQCRSLAQQSIAAEGERQGNRNERELVSLNGQPDHAERRDRDGQPLSGPQSLTEEQRTKHDADQRIDEVAKAGVDDMVVVDGPDVDEPVARQQKGTQREACDQSRLLMQARQPGPLTAQPQHDRQEQQGPDHPMGKHFERRHAMYVQEIQWKEPPCGVGGCREQNALAHACLAGEEGAEW